MKKFVMALVAVALAVGLMSCSSEVSTVPLASGVSISNDFGEGSVTIVELPDGERTVTCAVLIGYNKGGISCDWDGAR